MELLVGVVAGALVGSGAAHTHARVDNGWWINLLAGALGGLIGRAMWTDTLLPTFSDNLLAATAVAGSIGGIVIAVGAGVLRHGVAWYLRSKASAASSD